MYGLANTVVQRGFSGSAVFLADDSVVGVHANFIDRYGRGGIRTHGTIARTPDFESGAFDQLSHPSTSIFTS
jgi:hypothetical protein